MAQSDERKRRPWNAAMALRALEHELYSIDCDLLDEEERERRREEARTRVVARKEKLDAWLREKQHSTSLEAVEQEEYPDNLDVHYLVGSVVTRLRSLLDERDEDTKHLR